MIHIGSLCRLIVEDPLGWKEDSATGDLIHTTMFRIHCTGNDILVNGFRCHLISWFRVRWALKQRQKWIVDRYLSKKAELDLERAQTELDRVLTEREERLLSSHEERPLPVGAELVPWIDGVRAD
jgi:hypothetical protein